MNATPQEVPPPPSPRKYWTRRGIAEWLVHRLSEAPPTIVGIDHGFSFPIAYFTKYGLRHDGLVGNGAARKGDARWKRLTDTRAGSAKRVL